MYASVLGLHRKLDESASDVRQMRDMLPLVGREIGGRVIGSSIISRCSSSVSGILEIGSRVCRVKHCSISHRNNEPAYLAKMRMDGGPLFMMERLASRDVTRIGLLVYEAQTHL
jgi:hypothetical protein